jgi:peptide-methionine (S)-S-oxide reductase
MDAMPSASLVRLQPLGHLSVAHAAKAHALSRSKFESSNRFMGSAAGYGGRFDKLQGGSRGFRRTTSQRCEKAGEALRKRPTHASYGRIITVEAQEASMFFRKSLDMPHAGEALPGRTEAIATATEHFVFHRPFKGKIPDGFETVLFGMGCFWGAERKFWQMGEGIWLTAVGYAGGITPNPTYEETCSGRTGHTEVVQVVYDPKRVTFADLLRVFWENHDPTQGMRQGNDVGTQYRSAIFTTNDAQLVEARTSRAAFGERLRAAGYPEITTEIAVAGPFFYAEAYHQQYLAKNPQGYCGLGGTGVSCPIGLKA